MFSVKYNELFDKYLVIDESENIIASLDEKYYADLFVSLVNAYDMNAPQDSKSTLRRLSVQTSMSDQARFLSTTFDTDVLKAAIELAQEDN